MVKVWFPSMFMRLIGTDLKKSPPLATLQVSPRMTKTEVREYLTKMYDICVLKVNTENVAGGWKRLYGKRDTKAYRRRNYKLAYVFYDPNGVPSVIPPGAVPKTNKLNSEK